MKEMITDFIIENKRCYIRLPKKLNPDGYFAIPLPTPSEVVAFTVGVIGCQSLNNGINLIDIIDEVVDIIHR